MEKIPFAIVGSGWRACFYIRIANQLADKYNLVGVLCRGEEKASLLREKYNIKAVTKEKEIMEASPAFVVVAVNKASIAEVSAYWRSLGYVVLCETPVGLTREALLDIEASRNQGGPLVVAEQYCYYPTYKRIIEVAQSGIIGEVLSATVSLAHEYHGASLIRAVLGESPAAGMKIRARSYDLPVTKTADRYHIYRDGEVIIQKRVLASFEFEDGKFAEYDFDSQQYRSPIRNNMIKITGTRGEIIGEKLCYLDQDNIPRQELLFSDLQDAIRNPEDGGLSEDEKAIEHLMECTYYVSKGEKKWLDWQKNNLDNALQDAVTMLLLQEAEDCWKEAEAMPWQE